MYPRMIMMMTMRRTMTMIMMMTIRCNGCAVCTLCMYEVVISVTYLCILQPWSLEMPFTALVVIFSDDDADNNDHADHDDEYWWLWWWWYRRDGDDFLQSSSEHQRALHWSFALAFHRGLNDTGADDDDDEDLDLDEAFVVGCDYDDVNDITCQKTYPLVCNPPFSGRNSQTYQSSFVQDGEKVFFSSFSSYVLLLQLNKC